MNPFDMQGRVVLISGASSGIGAHLAQMLAAQGAHVMLGARRVDRLEALVADIRSQGGQAEAVALDVTSADSIAALQSQLGSSLPLPHVLLNNAGVAADPTRAVDTGDALWQQQMDVNLNGAFRLARCLASVWIAAGQAGVIVNTASIYGLRTGALKVAYNVSKAGLVQMTKSLAMEWVRHGIRVNALCPGWFLTAINEDYFKSDSGARYLKRIPMARLGQMEELNGPVLLLASEASSYMTGTTLTVDGGICESAI